MPKTTQKTRTKKTKTSKTQLAKTDELDFTTKARSQKMANVFDITKSSLIVLWRYKLAFGGILLLYGIVNLVIAQGFSAGTNVVSLKNQVSGLFHGQYNQVSGGLTVFALMIASVGSSGSSTSTSGGFGYKLFLIIIVSLAIIWAIRSAMSNNEVRIRDAYYKGMYPLIPFISIMFIIALELLPMIAGITIYVIAINNGIATNIVEQLAFTLFAVILSAVTIYWVSSSIFALYIVTLPDMTPLKALRSAKKLVRRRRWPILLRIIYLPVILLVISSLIMLPTIILVASLAPWVFLVLSLLLIAITHSYLYALYRELIE